jgi:DNA-binding NarL/FixJ family response regulator
VLLADDHDAVLTVAARLLGQEFEVVRAVRDGQAVLEAAAKLRPDVVVLDIAMPVLSGLEAARRLQADGGAAKVVFLTVYEDPDYLRAARAAGALGYVVKDRLASDLPVAVREALAGRPFVSPSLDLGTAR